ncbi:hypothetical protein HDU85_000634 [Gaertneriomyces sp. JEL0708]|nr:hypothetical protein HDU85_000634 [Gaertneriomyces sp. JEL0708]
MVVGSPTKLTSSSYEINKLVQAFNDERETEQNWERRRDALKALESIISRLDVTEEALVKDVEKVGRQLLEKSLISERSAVVAEASSVVEASVKCFGDFIFGIKVLTLCLNNCARGNTTVARRAANAMTTLATDAPHRLSRHDFLDVFVHGLESRSESLRKAAAEVFTRVVIGNGGRADMTLVEKAMKMMIQSASADVRGCGQKVFIIYRDTVGGERLRKFMDSLDSTAKKRFEAGNASPIKMVISRSRGGSPTAPRRTPSSVAASPLQGLPDTSAGQRQIISGPSRVPVQRDAELVNPDGSLRSGTRFALGGAQRVPRPALEEQQQRLTVPVIGDEGKHVDVSGARRMPRRSMLPTHELVPPPTAGARRAPRKSILPMHEAVTASVDSEPTTTAAAPKRVAPRRSIIPPQAPTSGLQEPDKVGGRMTRAIGPNATAGVGRPVVRGAKPAMKGKPNTASTLMKPTAASTARKVAALNGVQQSMIPVMSPARSNARAGDADLASDDEVLSICSEKIPDDVAALAAVQEVLNEVVVTAGEKLEASRKPEDVNAPDVAIEVKARKKLTFSELRDRLYSEVDKLVELHMDELRVDLSVERPYLAWLLAAEGQELPQIAALPPAAEAGSAPN